MIVGLGGTSHDASVALVDQGQVIGACAQERVTRQRGAGPNPSGLPDEALNLLLERLGRSRQCLTRYVAAEVEPGGGGQNSDVQRIEHHLAHAATAYLTSPFTSAAIIVCDHDDPKVSIWEGCGSTISRIAWPWKGPGFVDAYSRCARALGFCSDGANQRFEALARLASAGRDRGTVTLIHGDGRSVHIDETFDRVVQELVDQDRDPASDLRAQLADDLQAQVAAAFLALLSEVHCRTGRAQVCLGGSFFYHSSVNTLAKQAGIFSEVFVPADPGNAGLAVGAALHASGVAPQPISPFLGPAYSSEEVKKTLDNCKLQYSWEGDEGVIATVVQALRRGMLVGWFDGAMEWGPRALGARSILGNPFSSYVLENLNRFLKHRERWRGYAISGPERAVAEHFDGPRKAPFMESDYQPRDRGRWAKVLPSPGAALRIQTVSATCPRQFEHLIEAFGVAADLPFVVNTSFNAFHEPIVCSPRDAVRVFYGSGLDLVALGQFIIRK